MTRSISSLAFVVCMLTAVHAQPEFLPLSSARFARAVGLGNAFTGVAEGVESTHYNTAGLADLRHPVAAWSFGSGEARFESRVNPWDGAIVVPVVGTPVVAGVSWNQQSYQSDPYYDCYASSLNLHAAVGIVPGLSAGLSAHFYSMGRDVYMPVNGNTGVMSYDESGRAFDLSPSLLFTAHDAITSGAHERIRVGLLFRNMLGSSVRVIDNGFPSRPDYNEANYRQIRLGASYTATPSLGKIGRYDALSVMAAGDFAVTNIGDGFSSVQPSAGIEVSLAGLFALRVGREWERTLRSHGVTQINQYAATRFGFGLTLPVEDMLQLSVPFGLEVNCAVSRWDNIDGVQSGTGPSRLSWSVSLFSAIW
jgi:hypothetical protein